MTLFVGTKVSFEAAKQIRENLKYLRVDVEKVCAWLEFLKLTNPHYKNVKIPTAVEREEYKKMFKKEVDEIWENSIIADDALTEKMEEVIAANYTNAKKNNETIQNVMAFPGTSQPEYRSRILHEVLTA